jgi:hypothetical protein
MDAMLVVAEGVILVEGITEVPDERDESNKSPKEPLEVPDTKLLVEPVTPETLERSEP